MINDDPQDVKHAIRKSCNGAVMIYTYINCYTYTYYLTMFLDFCYDFFELISCFLFIKH